MANIGITLPAAGATRFTVSAEDPEWIAIFTALVNGGGPARPDDLGIPTLVNVGAIDDGKEAWFPVHGCANCFFEVGRHGAQAFDIKTFYYDGTNLREYSNLSTADNYNADLPAITRMTELIPERTLAERTVTNEFFNTRRLAVAHTEAAGLNRFYDTGINIGTKVDREFDLYLKLGGPHDINDTFRTVHFGWSHGGTFRVGDVRSEAGLTSTAGQAINTAGLVRWQLRDDLGAGHNIGASGSVSPDAGVHVGFYLGYFSNSHRPNLPTAGFGLANNLAIACNWPNDATRGNRLHFIRELKIVWKD